LGAPCLIVYPWCYVTTLKVAAERGLADAAYTYASLLNMGRGCGKDMTKAAEIFKTLARDGHPQATYNLAGMYGCSVFHKRVSLEECH
jgi:TPR repeat protein